MLFGFANTKIGSNHKLLSHNNLSFFEGGGGGGGGGGPPPPPPPPVPPPPAYFFEKQTALQPSIPFEKWERSNYD